MSGRGHPGFTGDAPIIPKTGDIWDGSGTGKA